MKVLLTGGAGYVGSAVLRFLLKHGHDPVAYDDLSTGNRNAVPAERLIVGDILDRSALIAALRNNGIEAVMHFAAVASVPDSIADPDTYWKVNLEGTKVVLDAMMECNLKKIVFSSTAATYGFENEMPLKETSAQLPEVPYGSSKLAAERIIKDYSKAYNIGYAIFRYFNASGADLDGEFGESRKNESHLIPLILGVAVGTRKKLFIYGNDFDTADGTCVRDYVHNDDIAQAHQLAVEKIQPGFRAEYNIGSGNGTTVLEVVKACEDVTGLAIPYEFAPRRSGDPGVLIASPEKLIHELGWKPKFSDIRNIVATAYKWHRSHPNGYDT
jgi:UDP-glucose 4-epimerase